MAGVAGPPEEGGSLLQPAAKMSSLRLQLCQQGGLTHVCVERRAQVSVPPRESALEAMDHSTPS